MGGIHFGGAQSLPGGVEHSSAVGDMGLAQSRGKKSLKIAKHPNSDPKKTQRVGGESLFRAPPQRNSRAPQIPGEGAGEQ